MTKSNELLAAEEHLRRKLGLSHPQGRWDGARWYLAHAEWCECCDAIRPPSRNWPWSQRDHARTVKHVARLHEVSEKGLRKCLVRVSVTNVAKALSWLESRGVLACPPSNVGTDESVAGKITVATDQPDLPPLIRLKF